METRRGRPKGSPNKVTASIKEAFKIAFDEMGGPEALIAWGRDNQTDFYKLVTKLIPTELTGADGGPIKTETAIPAEDKEIINRYLKEKK